MIMGRTRSTLNWFWGVRVATICFLFVASGCVERQIIVETNVPNSLVYIDNQPVGAAPTFSSFDYYGYYTITIVHPGYETLTERVHVTAPWYSYPPFDFAVEALWPFHIHDKRRYFFNLREITKPRVDDLLRDAEALRQRGYNLPTPEQPAAPRNPPKPPVQPQGGPIVPSVGPQPAPVVPIVNPQNDTRISPPVGLQPGTPSNLPIPSVLPQ